MDLTTLIEYYIKIALIENKFQIKFALIKFALTDISVKELYSRLNNHLEYIKSQIEAQLHNSSKFELLDCQNVLRERIASTEECNKIKGGQYELCLRICYYKEFLNRVEEKLSSSKNF